jgi:hypothetical protein
MTDVVISLTSELKALKIVVLGVTIESFTEIVRALHAFESKLSDVELLVSSEPDQTDTAVRSNSDALRRVRSELDAVKTLFRNLNRSIELQSRLELLQRDENGSSGGRSNSLSLLNQLEASKRYTESLKNSLDLLRKELELNKANSESLLDANQTIAKIADISDTYRGDVGQSRSLITQLKRRDLIDKTLVSIALCFFCLVVLYVLNNRLRVLRILSWLYSGMSSLTADGANLNNEETSHQH